MFFHIFKYQVIQLLRNKGELFWILCFPLLLATMFYFAFGNLFEDTEQFDPIPVAVITDDSKAAKTFSSVVENLSKSGDDQILDLITTDSKKAQTLLENQEICGIFYASDTVSLTISSDMNDDSINQSILKTILRQFNTSSEALTNIAINHPEKLEAAINFLSEDFSYNQEVSYSDGSMNVYVQYFYNLIAMVCLYTAMAGCSLAISNQGNLSALGMRKCISPVNKMKSICSSLAGCILVQFLCVLVSFLYMALILKIDFGTHIPQILLTMFVGCIAGVSFGFMIGSLGHMKSSLKDAVLICVIMLCCFFSGLMVGDMRIRVEHIFPLGNRINPATLITDCFYALNVYDTYTRFYTNIISLLIISAVFCFIGFLSVRREKYASL